MIALPRDTRGHFLLARRCGPMGRIAAEQRPSCSPTRGRPLDPPFAERSERQLQLTESRTAKADVRGQIRKSLGQCKKNPGNRDDQSPSIKALAALSAIPGPLISIRTRRSLSVVSTPWTTPEGV